MTVPTERAETGGARVAVVIATRNRCSFLLDTLDRLAALPEAPPIIVVDNASSDGTAESVRARHPDVHVIRVGRNMGGAGRNVGVAEAPTPYVAFADDDSWWAPGALARAAEALDQHERLAVVAARVLVGPEERLDPLCKALAESRLPHRRADAPGPAVLGFLACGAVVRRSAFLAVGGFCERFGIGGEEELLAIDLASDGWDLAYVPDVVAHHHPAPSRDPEGRRRRQVRNAVWCAWLRRPVRGAVAQTRRVVDGFFHDRATTLGAADALRGVPWVVRNRRVISPEVERLLRRRDAGATAAASRL